MKFHCVSLCGYDDNDGGTNYLVLIEASNNGKCNANGNSRDTWIAES